MTKETSQAVNRIGRATETCAQAYRDGGAVDLTLRHCPDCGEVITGIIADEIKDCADHLSHGELQEHYRWLRKEHKRLSGRL